MYSAGGEETNTQKEEEGERRCVTQQRGRAIGERLDTAEADGSGFLKWLWLRKARKVFACSGPNKEICCNRAIFNGDFCNWPLYVISFYH